MTTTRRSNPDERISLTDAGRAYLAQQRAASAAPAADDGLASEAEIELACAEVGTRLRGDRAGTVVTEYDRLMDRWEGAGY